MAHERIVVLDRDGVINEDRDDYVRSAEQWVPIRGSLEAIGDLTRAGVRILVVSNQSGLARGLFDIRALNAMHRKFIESAQRLGGRIEMILFCPHGPWEACECRKPGTRLIGEIAQRLGVNLSGVPFVGDSASDLQLARATGMAPILVKTGKGQRTLCSGAVAPGVSVFENLLAVSTELINCWGHP